MVKATVIAFIAELYAQEIEARAGAIKNAAKESDIKEGELYKLLKEGGYDPKAPKGTAAPVLTGDQNVSGQNSGDQNSGDQNGNDQNGEKQETGNVPILVSHKTEYEKYRCAGLVLTRKPENHLVTKAQFEKLSRDPWVVLKK